MGKGITFRLYLITDRAVAAPRSIVDVVERALSAAAPGEIAVQLREKDIPPRELLLLAERLVPVVHAAGGLLLVNAGSGGGRDRADVAKAAGADGLHLGGGSMTVAAARSAFPGAQIGVSTHAASEAAQAGRDGADFVVTGPVHATPSKSGVAVMGDKGLREVCRDAGLPVYALGGIDASNAAVAVAAGAAGVALIRAVMGADDPAAAARAVLAAMKGTERC